MWDVWIHILGIVAKCAHKKFLRRQAGDKSCLLSLQKVLNSKKPPPPRRVSMGPPIVGFADKPQPAKSPTAQVNSPRLHGQYKKPLVGNIEF